MNTFNKILTIILLVLTSNHVTGQCANSSNIYDFTYNGKSYEIVKENKTWIDAAACAVDRGGVLAEINDLDEQNAIVSEINNAGITFLPGSSDPQYMWIGGNDFLNEGNWVWDGDNDSIGAQFWMGTSTGNPVGGLFNNWGNDPDNYLGQHALAMSLICWAPPCETGLWTDMDHTNTIYYIIEYPVCNTTFSSITEIACDSYTSPSGKTYTSSDTYKDTIQNIAGCDSIITINLTVNSVNSSITRSGPILTADQTGCTYQWLNCPEMTTIDGAINQSYTPSLNGEYAVTVSDNGCIRTSDCFNICNNTFSNISETSCYNYTSPSGKTWTSSNTYLDTIQNTVGCDSIITINLIIKSINSTITQNGTSLTANQSGCTYQWLNCKHMTTINGEISKTFTTEYNGDYAVIIDNDNYCPDTSVCYTIEGLRINDTEFEKELLLYPNPTNGDFSIDLGKTLAQIVITITDINGNLIQSNTYYKTELLDLKLEQPPGIYILKIDAGYKVDIIRLVKE
jgi:hypothetical protein